MAGKPEERSMIAGERLRIAIKLFGLSPNSLVESPRWTKIVDRFDPSTISDWIRNGVPLRHLHTAATYFGVMGCLFIKPDISEDVFAGLVSFAKDLTDKPNADLAKAFKMRQLNILCPERPVYNIFLNLLNRESFSDLPSIIKKMIEESIENNEAE